MALATAGDRIPPPRPVVLWADSFSDAFDPGVPQAAVAVLRDAGYDVIVPGRSACCGLTWISTGQLDGARKKLKGLLDILAPFAVNGIPIVGLEPSCTAVLRSDLLELVPDDPPRPVSSRDPHAGRAAHRPPRRSARASGGAHRASTT